MNLFWQEFILFIVTIFALVVTSSSAWLFISAFKSEKQLKRLWRPLGFSALAIAFLSFILERKWPFFGLIGVAMSTFGFFCIWRGVSEEPKLSHLIKEPPKYSSDDGKNKSISLKGFKKFCIETGIFRSQEFYLTVGFFALLIILAFFIFGFMPSAEGFVLSTFEIANLVIIILTMRIQVLRFVTESKNPVVRRQNLYPIVGYVFLFFRSMALIFYRLPEFDVVTLRLLTLDFGLVWQASVVFTMLAFIYLGIWIWNFIKVRIALRIYIIILAIGVLVSTLGSLVFTTLVFQVVESNNYQLMEQGAKTENLIMQNHSDMAMFVARTMSNDISLMNAIQESDYPAMLTQTEKYLESSGADIIRIYDTEGKIVVSPSDIRDRDRIIDNDELLNLVFRSKSFEKAFDIIPGILSDIMITRSVYPIGKSNGDDFMDIPDVSENAPAIKALKAMGLIKGYEDGTFRPEEPVKRAELMKILIASRGMELDPAKYNNCFTDVKDEWFAPYICYAKEQGWVKGFEDGSFKPMEPVTLFATGKLMAETLDLKTMVFDPCLFLEDEACSFRMPYEKAVDLKRMLIPLLVEKERLLTRGQMAANLYRLFDIQYGKAFIDEFSSDTITGAIEVGYKFDNAFVDFSKRITGIDVTIYAGKRRSATTILTLDQASRWVGTEETDPEVLKNVLLEGDLYNTTLDRLGRLYYSSFTPVRDADGRIIGMVSVGVPTSVLFENVRQQLINSFLIVTLISVILALMGDLSMFELYKKRCKL